MRSLRSRMIVGSLLWMLGLLLVISLAGTMAVRLHPDYRSRMIVHYSAIAFVAVGFIAVGLLQVRRALAPFDRLRNNLVALREGSDRRIEGMYPTEVQPLVSDLNVLLDDRDRAVERAMSTAGDLAHGLKTPLAILAQEAERLDAAGEEERAATLRQQVERMRRQVDYHLAHARASASAGAAPGVRASLADAAAALARTLLRLHAARGVGIDVAIALDLEVRVRREDLEEMLGNLVDNGCKWARSVVRITASRDGADLVTLVDDDGPGLDAAMRDAVLHRGVRGEEEGAGSGLGLAIVRDLAKLYGGSVSLDVSPLGGVRARLRLPRTVQMSS